MELNEKTRLKELLAEYPWLLGEAKKLDPRFAVADTALGRALLKKYTIGDLAGKAGSSPDEAVRFIRGMLEAHGAEPERAD